MNELQRLLALVDGWQHGRQVNEGLSTFDLAALRTQLQQHAKTVRGLASSVELDVAPHVRAAADFLAPEDQ